MRSLGNNTLRALARKYILGIYNLEDIYKKKGVTWEQVKDFISDFWIKK